MIFIKTLSKFLSQRHRAHGEHKGKTKISGFPLCLGVSVRGIRDKF
jgi:hypothetical protein